MQRVAAHERRADVRPAARGDRPHALADRRVDPLERLGRQRASPSRRSRAGRARSCRRAGGEAGLGARGQVAGARAVQRHGGLRGDRELRVELRVARAAVVEHDRRPGQQAGDEPVPDHPVRRGVEEEAVGRAQVEVQRVVADVVEQLAAVAVDDPLGRAGGPRREEHVERVIEREGLERRRRRRRGQVLPGQRAGRSAATEPLHHHHRDAQAVERARDLRDGGAPVVRTPAVAIAVARDQGGGTQLGEAIQHARGREVGRARRPDRAHAGARQVGDHRLACSWAGSRPPRRPGRCRARAGRPRRRRRPGAARPSAARVASPASSTSITAVAFGSPARSACSA